MLLHLNAGKPDFSFPATGSLWRMPSFLYQKKFGSQVMYEQWFYIWCINSGNPLGIWRVTNDNLCIVRTSDTSLKYHGTSAQSHHLWNDAITHITHHINIILTCYQCFRFFRADLLKLWVSLPHFSVPPWTPYSRSLLLGCNSYLQRHIRKNFHANFWKMFRAWQHLSGVFYFNPKPSQSTW